MKKITLSELTHELNADKYALNDYYMVITKDDGNLAIQTMRIDEQRMKTIRINREQFYINKIKYYFEDIDLKRNKIKIYRIILSQILSERQST